MAIHVYSCTEENPNILFVCLFVCLKRCCQMGKTMMSAQIFDFRVTNTDKTYV